MNVCQLNLSLAQKEFIFFKDGLFFMILSFHTVEGRLRWLLAELFRLVRRIPPQAFKASFPAKVLETGVVGHKAFELMIFKYMPSI
jgi:hypothetical protein